MSNNSNINIKLTTKSKMATQSLHELSNSFVVLGKDGKRANTSINGLTNSLGLMSKAVKGIGLYKLSQGLATATQSAMDTRESIHMYNIAMGEFAESTGEAVTKLSELSGLDRVKMLDTVGEYALLARSMGMSSKNASVLSENVNRLALDMGALTNRPFTKVAEDFRSGLIGQSKTMYKYGIDVTEAAIKQEALNQGISKSVRHMSQGEKMALRYAVMIRQTGLAHGDFANTINEPANQLRILSERFVTLSRSIGNLFLPMLRTILPWLNAIVTVLTKIINAISVLFGGKAMGSRSNEQIKNTSSGFGDISDSVDGVGKSATGAGKKVDKLKKKLQSLAGFDELNILGQKTPETPTTGGGGTGGAGDFGLLDLDLGGYDSLIDKIEQKSDELVKQIEENLAKLAKAIEPTTQALKRLWEDGLKPLGSFAWDNLKSFYYNFIVPVGKWVFGEDGIPKLIDALTDLLKKIDWKKLLDSLSRLHKALSRFTIGIGKGLVDFFKDLTEALTPIVVKLLEKFGVSLDSFSDALNNISEDKLYEIGYGLGVLLTTIMGYKGVVGIFKKITGFFKELSSLFEGGSELSINPITAGFMLAPLFESLTRWVEDNAPEWVNTVFGILSDSLGGMAIGGLIGSFFGPTGALIGAIVGALVGATASIVKPFIKSIKEKFLTEIEILKEVWKEMTDPLVEKFNDARESINEKFSDLGQWFGEKRDEIEKAFKDMPEWLGDKFSEGWKNITDAFSKTKKWFEDNVSVPIKTIFDDVKKDIKKKIDLAWKSVNDAFKNTRTWFTTNVYTPISESFEESKKVIKEKIDLAWKSISDTFDKTRTWFTTNVKNPIGEIFNDIYNNINTWIDTKVKPLFSISKWKSIMSNASTGMVDGFKSGLNKVIDQFNKFISWVNSKMNFKWDGLNIGGKEIIPSGNMKLFNVPKIPKLARGGFPDQGSLFIAGEAGAELLGSHRGKTTVMPLEDSGFVEAMSSAVYSAVMSAMGSSGGSGGIVIQIGERTILDTMTDGVNRENIINGKNIITI